MRDFASVSLSATAALKDDEHGEHEIAAPHGLACRNVAHEERQQRPAGPNSTETARNAPLYGSRAYSARASVRTGIPGSAFFQSVNRSP